MSVVLITRHIHKTRISNLISVTLTRNSNGTDTKRKLVI